MKTIVVLGAHGGGTSLVAGLLRALGVQTHPNMKGRIKNYHTYEDADFMRLNIRILKAAGGDWKKPPPQQRINGKAALFAPQIKKLVAKKKAALWGWKDPRNSLTAPLYHPHLPNPRYILVTRPAGDAGRSVASRGPALADRERYTKLARTYYARAEAFLKAVDVPVLRVSYHELLNHRKRTVAKIAKFVGVKPDMKKALGVYR
jgi:hypothetical protein